jgi:hypothetical protein
MRLYTMNMATLLATYVEKEKLSSEKAKYGFELIKNGLKESESYKKLEQEFKEIDEDKVAIALEIANRLTDTSKKQFDTN